MIRDEIYKIDDEYIDKEIQILEDIAKISDVKQVALQDSTELKGVVDNAESMIGMCETIHHLESENYRKDGDHEKTQTAIPIISAVESRVSEAAMVNSESCALAAEENIILRQSVENLTRDLRTSIDTIARLKADVAASPTGEASLLSMQSKLDGEVNQLNETQIEVTLDQQSIDKTRILEQDNRELLKQNAFLQNEIHQLRNYHADLTKTISDFKQNAMDLSVQEFQVIVDEGCAEAASSSLIVLERSTTEGNNRLMSIQDAVDGEVQQPPTFDSVTSSSLSVVSNGSGADSILLNEVETVASLKVQLKRAHRGLLALTSKRVTVSDLSLEISTLQAALDESEKIREDNESVLRAMRKEILTAQSQLLEDSDSAKRDFYRFQNLELLENVLLQFRVVVGKKKDKFLRLKDTCTQLEHYCKHTIAEFKEKFLHVLRNAMEEKKESEKKLVFLASKVSRDTEAKDREDELLKAAMYHLGVRIVERNTHSAVTPALDPHPLPPGDLTEDSTHR